MKGCKFMSSIVLELQQEVIKPNCDILTALRKAHLIASKLKLTEFDVWIQNELNGYETVQDEIPEYRRISGQLKAWNPYHGWVPVILQDAKLEKILCCRKMDDSIGDILELYNSGDGTITMSFNANVTKQLNEWTTAPFETEYSLHISKHYMKSILDKVANCLMEWTLKLEEKGILGENMVFNEKESTAAKEISQQVNNYYGNVIQGNVSGSQIVSGDGNTVTYNAGNISNIVDEIRESLTKEKISEDDMESAIELLEDISDKLEQNKKPGIIKAAFVGLKDFVLAAGANITANLITAKMNGMF